MQIVEDDDDAAIVSGETVQELVDCRLDARPGRPQPGQGGPGDSGSHAIDRPRNVAPEPQHIVVESVEGDPSRSKLGPNRKPRRHEHCLSRARRATDHRQLVVLEPIENRVKPLAWDHTVAEPRSRELCLDHGDLDRFGWLGASRCDQRIVAQNHPGESRR